MEKVYDEINKRLIIFEEQATPEYWDKHWFTDGFIERVKRGKNNRFIKKYTTKYLKPGAKILEGGCGIGRNVYALSQWGYEVYGVDFAKKTVEKLEREFPDLKISMQDVRKLEFADGFFDGYWSLGVIEHFWEGYNEILNEVKRVIKPGGYLFLTFPYLSPLRKFKVKLGIYELFENNPKVEDFYQFILDLEKVRGNVEKYGFKLILKRPFAATKCIKDEISLLKPILQRIYDSQSILARGIKFSNSILFAKLAGHSILLVFRKL